MMISSNACQFFLFYFPSLSANAETDTIRGVHPELTEDLVKLGTANNFVILAKTGISTFLPSVITGNIGLSPIAAAAMTGFGLIMGMKKKFATSSQLTGKAYTSGYAPPTPIYVTTAVGDMETTYTNVTGRTTTSGDTLNVGGSKLAGHTLTPGIYTFGTDVNILDTTYLKGTDTDLFIIQISGDLIQAAGKRVILLPKTVGGTSPLPVNIVWQVAGSVLVKSTAHMEGILLVKSHAVFQTGSSLNGRVLTQMACTLDSATINQP